MLKKKEEKKRGKVHKHTKKKKKNCWRQKAIVKMWRISRIDIDVILDGVNYKLL